MKTDNKFPILYSDFPWRFRNVKTGGTYRARLEKSLKPIQVAA